MEFEHKDKFNKLTQHLSKILIDNPFSLLDVGCSGGIDSVWRRFDTSLIAIGIDPIISECKRLQEQESNSNIKYIPGLILSKTNKLYNQSYSDPYDRLSGHYYSTIAKKQQTVEKCDQLLVLNNWQDMQLSVKNITIGSIVNDTPINLNFTKIDTIPDIDITIDQLVNDMNRNLDFIKIDIDGNDFEVLESAIDTINNSPVLGVAIEINFHGRDEDNSNTLHNVDRTLRKLGFDLFDLSSRKYTSAKLPGKFVFDMFAQTSHGRIYQGDAIYLRDPVAITQANNPIVCPELSLYKIIKLACLFELFGLPDHAAELLIHYSSVLNNIINIDECLNILTKEVTGQDITYNDFIEATIKDPTILFPNN
jgi:hypothetical protein